MYHIYYRPKGQRSSDLISYVPSRPREVWDSMVLQSNRTGGMTHPETGAVIEFASLQYGGKSGDGGMMCQRWDKDMGLKKIYEPEPQRSVIVDDVPEQPPPPVVEIPPLPMDALDNTFIEMMENEPIAEESDL